MHYETFPQFKAGLRDAPGFPQDWSDAKIDILFQHYRNARAQASLTLGRLAQTQEMRATKGSVFEGGKGQLLLTPEPSGFSSTATPAASTFGRKVVPKNARPDWDKLSPYEQMNTMLGNKWSIWLNDAFILGGIHNHAAFHLVSNMNLKGDSNSKQFPFNVTQRELIGLCTFGYSGVVGDLKAGTEFKCTKAELADAATFKTYGEEMLWQENRARGVG